MGNKSSSDLNLKSLDDSQQILELNFDSMMTLKSYFQKSYPNGLLTKAEFVRENSQLHSNSSEAFWETLFHALDHDNNGVLDLREYLIAYSIVTNVCAKESRLQFWFHLLDQDSSGGITFEECEYLFATLIEMSDLLREESSGDESLDNSQHVDSTTVRSNSPELRQKQEKYDEQIVSNLIIELFNRMDANKDGVVTFDEFKKAVENDEILQKLLFVEIGVEKQALLHRSAFIQPEAFKMQVAGHGSEKLSQSRRNALRIRAMKQKEGIQKIDDKIWKPLDEVEYDFYEYIYHPSREDDPQIKELKNFIPKYYGRTFIEFENKKVVYYIIMEDILTGMPNIPCVADLKIGNRGYDNRATFKKRVQQIGFCKLTTSRTLGFRFCGYKSFDLVKNEERTLSKLDGGLLNTVGVETHLRRFIDNGRNLRYDVYLKALEKLKIIQEWFLKQKRFQFYSSSLLIAYDGGIEDSDVVVKMVDFAHTDIDENENTPDKSYIFGLTRLINLLEDITKGT